MIVVGEFLGSLILFLAALALIRYLCHLIAGFFAARKTVEPHPTVPCAQAIVTLVHGTFARKAPWTLPGSPLCLALAEHFSGRVQLRRFDWSGRNSFRARSAGVAALAQDLDRTRREWPGTAHYLVGHSHGGSVAIGAAMKCPAGAVDGVVCLATPVLTTRLRRFSPTVRTMIGFGFFLTLVLPWIDFEHSDADPTNLETAAIIVSALLAFGWYRIARRLAHTICDAQPYSRLDPQRVAFVRSPFDEASGVIGLANLLSWTVSRLTAGPFDLVASFERLEPGRSRVRMALGYAALTGLGWVLWLVLERLPPDTSRGWVGVVTALAAFFAMLVGGTAFALTLIAPLLRRARHYDMVKWILWPVYFELMVFGGFIFVPAILLMSLAHAAAVGIELLLCSVLVEVTAEPCPAGNWTVYQLSPPPEGNLRHSSVYESDAGLAALILALDGIAGEQPVPLMNEQAELPAAALGSAAPA
jgi:pimeloyl-ACP methyl ester carboxylesterase